MELTRYEEDGENRQPFADRFFADLEKKDAAPEIRDLARELAEKILKGEEIQP